jgi:hypothetical protein
MRRVLDVSLELSKPSPLTFTKITVPQPVHDDFLNGGERLKPCNPNGVIAILARSRITLHRSALYYAGLAPVVVFAVSLPRRK